MLLGSPVIFGSMCHFFLTHCPLEGYYAHFFFLFLFLFLWMYFLYLYPSPCSHGPIRGTFWRFNRHISLTIYCHLSLVNNMCNTYFVTLRESIKINCLITNIIFFEQYWAWDLLEYLHLASVCFTPQNVNQTQHCHRIAGF